MVLQITTQHANALENKWCRLSFFTRLRSLFLPIVIRTVSRYPRALSRAIDCCRHRRHRVASRRVVSHRILFVSLCLCAIRGTFSIVVLPASDHCFPGTSVEPTWCNKFATVPHNCRKPRVEDPLTGSRWRRPCASSDWNFMRIVGIFPCHNTL